MGTHSLL
jgi:hypothetical protein